MNKATIHSFLSIMFIMKGMYGGEVSGEAEDYFVGGQDKGKRRWELLNKEYDYSDYGEDYLEGEKRNDEDRKFGGGGDYTVDSLLGRSFGGGKWKEYEGEPVYNRSSGRTDNGSEGSLSKTGSRSPHSDTVRVSAENRSTFSRVVGSRVSGDTERSLSVCSRSNRSETQRNTADGLYYTSTRIGNFGLSVDRIDRRGGLSSTGHPGDPSASSRSGRAPSNPPAVNATTPAHALPPRKAPVASLPTPEAEATTEEYEGGPERNTCRALLEDSRREDDYYEEDSGHRRKAAHEPPESDNISDLPIWASPTFLQGINNKTREWGVWIKGPGVYYMFKKPSEDGNLGQVFEVLKEEEKNGNCDEVAEKQLVGSKEAVLEEAAAVTTSRSVQKTPVGAAVTTEVTTTVSIAPPPAELSLKEEEEEESERKPDKKTRVSEEECGGGKKVCGGGYYPCPLPLWPVCLLPCSQAMAKCLPNVQCPYLAPPPLYNPPPCMYVVPSQPVPGVTPHYAALNQVVSAPVHKVTGRPPPR